MKNKVTRICITGGPCAGKTSSFSYNLRSLTDFGYKVFIVEEAATQVIMSGFDPDSVSQKNFQRIITGRICQNEEMIEKIISSWSESNSRPIIVLYDRSHIDSSAYCENHQDFVDLLEEVGLTPEGETDKFDLVLHLVTAADGAEEFYTLDNNPARYETPEQARVADKKTKQAWSKCSHLRFIENIKGSSFENKMKRALGEVCHTLGLPQPLEIERKWIMSTVVTEELLRANGIDVIGTVPITQTYLPNGDRIRKRHEVNSTYFLTHKHDISPGVRYETEEMIDSHLYKALFEQRDLNYGVIKKKRINFEYKGQWFEIDTFTNCDCHQIMELELTDTKDKINLPPFLGKLTDVTNNHSFYNKEIARRMVTI